MGVATASALIGTGLSAYQTIKAGSDRKKAERDAANYNRQDLINSYKNIQLSTYGTDVMKEQSARNAATMIDASRSGGARTVASTLPRIQANLNSVDQQIAMDLEKQDIARQRDIARGEERLTLIKEQRDIDNLNAISSQYNAANQDFNRGLWGVASGISSLGRQVDFGGFTPKVSAVNATNPQGVSLFETPKPVGITGPLN